MLLSYVAAPQLCSLPKLKQFGVSRIDTLETKINSRVDVLETNINSRIDALANHLTAVKALLALVEECTEGCHNACRPCEIGRRDLGNGGCVCDPALGNPYDDGNACTSGKSCQEDGTCGGGIHKECIGNQCQASECDPNTGECVLSNVPGDQSCVDFNPCTTDTFCVNWQCQGSWLEVQTDTASVAGATVLLVTRIVT